jgi:hypothetical protein
MGKALRANEANKKQFDSRRVQLEARNIEMKAEATKIAEKLEGKSYVIIRSAGESGQLYGSVASRDVSDAINGLQADARIEDASVRALAAAEQSYVFTQRQQQLGEVGTFALLQSQAALQQARLQRTAAWASRLVDTVALYQANGQADEGQD